MGSISVAARAVQLALLIEAVASFSARSTTVTASHSISRDRIASSLPQIPTISASEFDPNIQYYHTIESRDGGLLVYETPVIVEGVLSEEACEKLTDDLVSECGSIEVTLQRKRRESSTSKPFSTKGKKKTPKTSKRERRKNKSLKNANKSKENNDTKQDGGGSTATTTDQYLCSFLEAIDLVLGQSKHDDALLAFCEGLLNPQFDTQENNLSQIENSSSQLSLQQKMEDVREELFQQQSPMNLENDSGKIDTKKENIASRLIDPCWFREYFPTEASPTDCVILAGEGATSTLHRDPLEWTGTNLCLDGTKVWRFVAPPLAAAAVEAARQVGETELPCDPLGDERSSSVVVIDELLDAYRLDSIAWGDRGDDEDPLILSAGWQSDYSLFASFNNGISSGDPSELEEKQGTKEKLDTISRIASDADRLQPDIPVGIVGFGDSAGENGAEQSGNPVTVWSGVQKPGDMIVIPAHWWHQTYAMEASLAIASQRCGAKRDSERVLRHILETTANTANLRSGTATEPIVSNKGLEDRTNILSLLRSKSSSSQDIVDRLFDYLAALKEERKNSPNPPIS
mmetsp:Transcript_24750/g.54324  ORF Transcript_24750/g.54324 Transcript_24750/m.54324 type:complete len:573 (+) Transcript_24750:114-1832(+)